LTTVITTAEQRGKSVADDARFDQARHGGISRSIRAAQVDSELKCVHLSNKGVSSQDKHALALDGGPAHKNSGSAHTSCEPLDTPPPFWKTPPP
jgi:hypothetical protein